MASAARKQAVPLHRDPVVLAAFAFAFVARLAFAAALPAADFPHRRYLGPAVEFLHGRWFSAGSADQLPGAPLLFAICMLFVGENFSALAIVQHALGLATWCLMVRAAGRAGGLRTARWMGWLLAAQLIFPFEERFILSEATAHFLFAAALDAAVGLREDPGAGRSRFAFAGWTAGLAALTRGELLLLGPLLATALALPRKDRSLGRLGVYAAAWLLTIGGWIAHNRLAGCNGFNASGSSFLIDTALPLVRYDLPSEPLVKRILREEEAAYGWQGAGTARLRAVERLRALDDPERGYPALFRAQFAVGRVAREAILTRPLRYAAIVWSHFRGGFRPIAWVSQDQLVDESAVRRSRSKGGWRERFWTGLERGPQFLGWAPLLLVLLSPLGLFFARPKNMWASGLLAAIALGIVCAGAPINFMVSRYQAGFYLPLCMLGGLSADFLAAAWAAARGGRGGPGAAR
ncbi:MAG: hypothetical protein HY923_09840 [Elusimicrobia bacterium]|nr:hypothetical protein [Elusimicrobiota bacterium]